MSSRARRIDGSAVAISSFPWGGHAAAPAASSPLSAAPPVACDADAVAMQHEAHLAALERDAFAKGFAQGERAGAEAAGQRGEATLYRLTDTLNELTTVRTEMIRQTERQMVHLALAIARRILHREVSLDPNLLLAMARVALERLGESARVSVRLHPEDYAAAGAARVADATGSNVTIVSDARLSRGACRVESDMGLLDVGIDAQLQEVGRALLATASRALQGSVVPGVLPVVCSPGFKLMSEGFSLDRYVERLSSIDTMPPWGRVVRTVGLLIESTGPRVGVGTMCVVGGENGAEPLPVQVVGFRDSIVLSVPLGDTVGVKPGDRITARAGALTVPVGDALLGRVVDALGRPLDGAGPIETRDAYPLFPPPMNPMARDPVADPLPTGVRAIDAMLTCGRGQRVGLFGGSGVGKSTLMGMLTRGTAADVVVCALVGERGREVRSFIEHDLGPEGMRRAVVVVSTSDNPPLMRLRCAYTATSIAEYFRDQGLNVLLLMDSVTRFAMAQREVGLAAGEPPTTKGYPPSVFALLPTLLERAGAVRDRGSITAMYTVLVDGDDHNEPVADAVRSILDGHFVLSRDLASQYHYPPIDILQSVSRTMPDVTEPAHRQRAAQVREWMAAIRDSEDLVSVGAYVPGSNPRIDDARGRRDGIKAFLCQESDMVCGYSDAIDQLAAL